jgi:hypothetical protein
VDTVRDEVERRLGARSLSLLERERVPWRLAPYFGGGVKWRTVLTKSAMCWRRYTINLALDSEGVKLSDEMPDVLDAFERAISNASNTVDFLMQEGELLFTDNRRTVHARTPITDGASDRLMLRSWIRTS